MNTQLLYLIKSITFLDQKYIGHTDNLKKRLETHNPGGSIHTKSYRRISMKQLTSKITSLLLAMLILVPMLNAGSRMETRTTGRTQNKLYWILAGSTVVATTAIIGWLWWRKQSKKPVIAASKPTSSPAIRTTVASPTIEAVDARGHSATPLSAKKSDSVPAKPTIIPQAIIEKLLTDTDQEIAIKAKWLEQEKAADKYNMWSITLQLFTDTLEQMKTAREELKNSCHARNNQIDQSDIDTFNTKMRTAISRWDCARAEYQKLKPQVDAAISELSLRSKVA